MTDCRLVILALRVPWADIPAREAEGWTLCLRKDGTPCDDGPWGAWMTMDAPSTPADAAGGGGG